jgi:uncharacterized protein YjiS (DUF1127 family)
MVEKMSVFEVARPVPLGSDTTFRIVSMFQRLAVNLSNWRSSLATANALHGLSDEQLDDIGLNRGEIDQIAGSLASRRF